MTAYVLRLFSGIGAFLIGMRLISTSLTGVAGGKIEELFKKLGNNKLAAVGVGVGSAAVLQSSSATTVILLGLVNAGISLWAPKTEKSGLSAGSYRLWV